MFFLPSLSTSPRFQKCLSFNSSRARVYATTTSPSWLTFLKDFGVFNSGKKLIHFLSGLFVYLSLKENKRSIYGSHQNYLALVGFKYWRNKLWFKFPVLSCDLSSKEEHQFVVLDKIFIQNYGLSLLGWDFQMSCTQSLSSLSGSLIFERGEIGCE